MNDLKCLALLAGSSLAAIGIAVCAPAFAQSEAPAEANAIQARTDEIIVTARRREESTLDVPIAVSAFNQSRLTSKGVERVDDLQRIAPSISFKPTAGRRSNSQYEIRGINATESLITGDAPVGIYVDEVYRARATGTNQSFYDIDNVQVLYGPQGTLFGRNSSAGAVLINTKRPTDQFEGQVSAGVGNLGRYELTGILNLPINDKLAVRVAGQRSKRDGYGTNVTTDSKLANINNWSGRISVLFKPTDTITNTTIGSFYRANEKGSLVFLLGYRPCPSATATVPAASCSTRSMPDVPTVDTRTIGQALAQAAATSRTLSPWQTALDPFYKDFGGDLSLTADPKPSEPFERSRNFSLTNITEFELSDSITLKNVFGYNKVRLIALNDLDGTPIKLVDSYYDTQAKQYSNEFQVQGDMGSFNWVAGGMYFRERGHDLQNSTQNVYSETRTDVVGVNKSYAVFAQGTYKLTDKLSVTAGGRYTWDKRFVRYVKPITYALALNTLARPAAGTCNISPVLDTDGDCIFEDNASFKQPTYTFSVDYKPNRDMLFYVAHRLGYRSGGLQARVGLIADGPPVGGVTPTTTVPAFEPEKVRDVELGFKGSLDLGGQRHLNTAITAYSAWYSGVQRQITVVTGLSATTNPVGATTTTAQLNVGKAKVQGMSFEGDLTIVPGFAINGHFGYVDGKYTTFQTASAVASNVPFASSKYTAGFGLSLTPIDDPAIGKVTVSPFYSYRSRFTMDQSLPNLEPESYAPAQHMVNVTVNWERVAGTGVDAQLWVRNATNEPTILGMTTLASSFGVTPGVRGEPRTYGLTLGYKF